MHLEEEQTTRATEPTCTNWRKKIGRQQWKNTYNNIKSNMASPEMGGSTTTSQHTDEAEENDLKYNFMKMIKALKRK